MDHTEKSSAPLYRQVARAIEADITAGRLVAGARLPSERDLAQELKISRMTARQAMRHLVERGLLVARVGQGTFVRSGGIRQQLVTLSGFSEEMARQGRQTASIVVEAATQKPGPETALALGLTAGALVHRLTRIRLADGAPVAVECTELDAARMPDVFERADFTRQSLYATLRACYGIQPSTAEQSLQAVAADAQVALQLAVPRGAPVLDLRRTTRDDAGRAFEFVRSAYRGDVFTMNVTLNLEASAR